jgi:hypothetical protein
MAWDRPLEVNLGQGAWAKRGGLALRGGFMNWGNFRPGGLEIVKIWALRGRPELTDGKI